MTDPRRMIPSVDHLLGSEAMEPVIARWGRARVTAALRQVQTALRVQLEDGSDDSAALDAGWYAARAEARLREEARPSLSPVINATGVVLHTNLGRAPLAEAARRAVAAVAGYAALEMDLDTGERGSRHAHCTGVLRELTGAESALVVNNNAAAVMLAVNTLAAGREVVVSRGELVEIGGSFRIAEIVQRSGARLREVGSTNRTHPEDYRDALGQGTGLILRVHRSNFRVEGFTAEVPPLTLAGIAREAGVPLVDDLGSGLLVDPAPFGLPEEPTARQALERGADLVTMSGDKLLGGPQAGIVVGRAELVERLRSNPLSRAVRPDKLTLAALEATLALYRDPEIARREIPVLRMLSMPATVLQERASRLRSALEEAGVEATITEERSTVGGGALPGVELPTTVVVVPPGPAGADDVARRLRTGTPAVVARVRGGVVRLDLRTVAEAEEPELVRRVVEVLVERER